jgi:nucleotide-binding universal stress UspA family protein
MIVIKNVLVATDFSEPAAAALAYGRELARSYGATLHVLNAIDDIRWRYSLDMSPALLVGVQDDLEENSRQWLAKLLTDEDRTQLHARPVTFISGSPADTIVEYAKSAKIDVIVIGTHGRRGMSHMLMGSVAERVVRLAPCPVLTVREHEREFMTADALAVTKAHG